mmetsp:Transcript_10099/g.12253  ORF Transcript_10099/g.12253 Transcript_10099/m.12253 type:complete len:233 (-) Transcript_10099:183-881(-)|eukprot:CAMPEP_0114346114 /NCGR_PEP_ID=MMETSP0101-20121206/12806_1 /TAXON_ID=38822 ORGANISM="Pteridomonas danica, Strain PT" /NCGR_SAMPLE_ID=MMETSP0101 /ASSEMBLY_ACC=CAM_ASM_000211 /LENGTH=232 /DNA_ID=CAMNT_0001482559 /DNA_START=32 /DNA_END=730 /DNA_ORIENTATION=+
MGSIQSCVPCSEAPKEEVPVMRRPSHKDAELHKDSIRLPLLRVVFEAMDKDKSGSISYEELSSFGQYIGNRDWTEESVKALFKAVDKDKDGQLSLQEFEDFCFSETEHHSSERFQAMITGFIEVGNLIEERKSMIEAVYKKIDVTNSGSVNREEMMEFGRFMNAKFDEDKLNKLMDQMDLDQDGLISYHEFLAYFAKLSKPIEDASFSKGIQRYLKFEKGSQPTEETGKQTV